MTPIDLLEALETEVKTAIKDLRLPVKQRGRESDEPERVPLVYLMDLPDKTSLKEQAPYVLLQFLTGEDTQAAGERPRSACTVRMVAVTYDRNDMGAAKMAALNVITRIKIHLERRGEAGERFLLERPLEYLIYPENDDAYAVGEMITRWEMPAVEREVALW